MVDVGINISKLKERIEFMPKYHQIEILRLLNNAASVKKNENNNGTFVNLTEQSKEVLIELEKYANYVDDQQKHLNKVGIAEILYELFIITGLD